VNDSSTSLRASRRKEEKALLINVGIGGSHLQMWGCGGLKGELEEDALNAVKGMK